MVNVIITVDDFLWAEHRLGDFTVSLQPASPCCCSRWQVEEVRHRQADRCAQGSQAGIPGSTCTFLIRKAGIFRSSLRPFKLLFRESRDVAKMLVCWQTSLSWILLGLSPSVLWPIPDKAQASCTHRLASCVSAHLRCVLCFSLRCIRLWRATRSVCKCCWSKKCRFCAKTPEGGPRCTTRLLAATPRGWASCSRWRCPRRTVLSKTTKATRRCTGLVTMVSALPFDWFQ